MSEFDETNGIDGIPADQLGNLEASPSHPDYYKRLILPLGETGRRIVVASRLSPDIGSGLYVGLEVDNDGIPVPEPHVQAIAITDLRSGGASHLESSRQSSRLHHHFALGGPMASVGIFDPEKAAFDLLTDPATVEKYDMGSEDLRIASLPEGTEWPALSSLIQITKKAIERDWSDMNSRHNPDWLATYVSQGVVWALGRASMIDFDVKPGQLLEETSLYQEIATAITSESVWERLKTRRHTARDEFLSGLRNAYYHTNNEGDRAPLYGDIYHYISDVVRAQTYETAEQVIREHQAEIQELDSHNAWDTEDLADIKERREIQERETIDTGITEGTSVSDVESSPVPGHPKRKLKFWPRFGKNR